MAEYKPILEEHSWFVGEKKVFEFEIVDENEQAVDISFWDLEWVLRPANESPTIFLVKTTSIGDGIVRTVPGDGICQVTVMPNDTLTIEAGAGVYDYALKRSDGDNDTVLAYGEATLLSAATR